MPQTPPANDGGKQTYEQIATIADLLPGHTGLLADLVRQLAAMRPHTVIGATRWLQDMKEI